MRSDAWRGIRRRKRKEGSQVNGLYLEPPVSFESVVSFWLRSSGWLAFEAVRFGRIFDASSMDEPSERWEGLWLFSARKE
ncbi:Unannotated [Lentimonas sp. CC4]|nr:Unannotated [Lentimonas sp. CC4]CAA6686195.1 Unannotated [Lentimonas sp. CC6]CAA7074227.1 Unannotated [Lentimonas sp. CC4]CAA7171585.1 Unannotated [Lentimonas sp. CC21]CAA7183101.1 Unannotated [Lentimonas sp. CC8]